MQKLAKKLKRERPPNKTTQKKIIEDVIWKLTEIDRN